MADYDFSMLDGSPQPETDVDFSVVDSANINTEFLDTNSDSEIVNALPDKLRVGFYQTDIPLDEDVSAFLVGAGHMMTDVYRGVKQLIGIDEESMASSQKMMDGLYADDEVGTAAIAGAITGALAEPAGLLIPGGKARSVTKAVAKGVAIGGTYGALSYVNEDKGQTRLGNAALGGTLGGAFSGVLKKGTDVYKARKVVKAGKTIADVEKRWAEKLLQDKPTSQIRKELREELPKLKLKKTARDAGRNPALVSTKREAQHVLDFYTSPTKQSDISTMADSIGGILSTRVRNKSEAIFGKLREHDMNVLKRSHEMLEESNVFLHDFSNKVPKDQRDVISSALFNGDHDIVRDMLNKHGGDKLVKEFNKVTSILDGIGDELTSAGRLSEKLDNYFPRFVKDKEGLFEKIGKVQRSSIEDALSAANTRAMSTRGSHLSPLEESEVINKALRGFPVQEYKPGFSKQRQIQNVSEDLLPFYASPEESLHSYIRNAINDIEKIKFFGKDIKYKNISGINMLDLDESVGGVIQSELVKGRLSSGDQDELKVLLSTRFGIGEKSPASIIQDTKNIMYASLLGNPVSAATQIGDVGVSIYMNGFKNTFRAISKNIRNKEISAAEFGLLDNMAEEFATTSKTAKFLRGSLKWGGFRAVDKFGKDTFITASLGKYRKLAQTTKGRVAIRSKYEKIFGDEFGDLVQDLGKGKMTDNVKMLLFNELADVQPVSLSEVPEMYLKMPNGRVAYMLKTFMLKQLDVVRREAFQEIKKGHVAKGTANLMRYGLVMGAGGTASQYIKDWMLGKDVEADIPADIASNLFKTFGLSEYVGKKLADGKPVEAIGDIVMPPFGMFDKVLQMDEKALQYMPIGGRLWYYWFGGGLEEFEKKQRAKKQKKYTEKYQQYGAR